MILNLRRILCVLIALSALPAAANTLSFTGNLPANDPNAYVLICFDLTVASDITVNTFGYGGGVNGNGNNVGGTGFQSVLDLYDGSGNLLLDSVADPALSIVSCPPANTDAGGFCGDASLNYGDYYHVLAPAGEYTLALLTFGNGPAGFTLADGFLGTGTFVGNDGLRDSSYAVDITASSLTPCPAPEPASLLLLGSALPWLLRLRRRNH